MDKLIGEMLLLLRELLASNQRLLQIALLRQDAMRAFDVQKLNELLEREKLEAQRLETLEKLRRILVEQMKLQLGRGVEPNISELAKRATEPNKSILLSVASQLRTVVEQLDRNSRINAKVSETVIRGLSHILKIVTGVAQHAGLYMRNGRKAALHGIHVLEVTA